MQFIYCLFVCTFFLAGCSGNSAANQAPKAIEGYLQALVKKDVNQMINLSCAAWEAQARQEFDSFAAVELKLENLACQSGGQEGEVELVVCTGKMIASYGEEDLEIDFNQQTYRAVKEGGEWRMCGYR